MLLAPAFRNLDAALEESSRISGASGWHTFFHIIIPVMMPAILVTTILGIIRSLEAFEIELLLGTPIGLQVYSTKIHELVTQRVARRSSYGQRPAQIDDGRIELAEVAERHRAASRERGEWFLDRVG
jgi:ABC-type Fe3+ transport system permease subunit